MRTLTTALLFLVASCGGDTPTETEPEPEPFELTLTGERTSHEFTERGRECGFRIDVRAFGGEEGDYAQWESADGEYREIDSGNLRGDFTLDPTDLADWFGSERVQSGETRTANRVTWSGDSTAFHLDMNFRYRKNGVGPLNSRFYRLECAD